MSALQHPCRASCVSVLLAVGALTLVSSAAAQCDAQRIVSPVPHTQDRFGTSVASDGEWVFVASPLDDTTAPFGGIVDVFRFGSQGVLQHTQRLVPSLQTQWMLFGWAMAADAGRLVVGAPYLENIVNPPAGPHAWPPGEAFVFELVNGTWVESAHLTPSNGVPTFGPPGESFGQAVALDGTHLLIGAPLNDATGQDEGTLYAFEETPSGWVEVQRMQTLLPGRRIGEVFDVEGDTLVVKQGLYFNSNAALHEWDGAQWVFRRGLFSPLTSGIRNHVALSEGQVAMSDPDYTWPNTSHMVGVVAIFEDPATSSVNPTLVYGPGASTGAVVRFGAQFALAGDALVAVDLPQGAGGQPRVYRYLRGATGWTFDSSFTQAPATYDAAYGRSIVVDGPRVFVGAPLETNAGLLGAGAVWLSLVDDDISGACPCDLVAPCGATDPVGGCVNSTGQSARFSGCGTASVATDDLTLRASGLPTFQFVLPFMGDALDAPVVLGAGRRCAAGAIKRFPPVLVGSAGTVTFGPGIASSSATLHGAGVLTAGTTWTFQLWYRDNAQACSNVNLTNGVTVRFRP